jgi:hypothetical protein
MDFYADMPMPSLESRVEELLKLVRNPTDRHVMLATEVAKQTPGVSLMGYCSGVRSSEQRRFLEAYGGSDDTSTPS